MRIHILGGPGSGKTTLAELIAARFNIPHHDLDHLYWKHDRGGESYIEEAFALAEQPEWITENIGLIWIDPLLYYADYIVLMEISWQVAAWRIIRRHISKSVRGINPYPTKLLLPFLKDARRYYLSKASPGTPVAEAMRADFEEQGDITEPPDAEILLKRLERGKATIPLSAEFTRQCLEKYKEKVIVVRNNADRERLLGLLAKQHSQELCQSS